MDQYTQEKSHPSQLQSSQNQTEDIPLSSTQSKPEEFSQTASIHNIGIHKLKYAREKQAGCRSQKKAVFAILFIIVLVLVGINNFVFQTLQLFSSLEEKQSQLPYSQSEAIKNERIQQLQPQPSLTNFDHKKDQTITDKREAVQVNDKLIELSLNTQADHPAQANIDSQKTTTVSQKANPFKILAKSQETTQLQQNQKNQRPTPLPRQKRVKIYYKKNSNSLKGLNFHQVKENYNILSKIPKNPFVDEKYSMISTADITRVSKWRALASQYYNTSCKLAEEELEYYVKKYDIGLYQQLPFCIVIPTLNNLANSRAEKNLKSVLMQNYSNYRVMIIDDGSNDGTPEFIQNFLQKQNILNHQRYRIQKNQHRKFALPNVLNAARNYCHPQDIFIVLDGDDQLLGKQVLKLFNAVFQKEEIWFMYTNFISSIGTLGYSRPYPPDIMKNNTYRDYGFTVTHLRAYYTQLLLNIKDQDLRDENGNYFTAAGDMAIVMPCLEQANQRVRYVPEITYLYNLNTGQNVHSNRLNQQRRNNLKIRAKERYQRLQTLF